MTKLAQRFNSASMYHHDEDLPNKLESKNGICQLSQYCE